MKFKVIASWLMACAKTSALGPCEARYSRMRRVLRVITAATSSSLVRKVSTWPKPYPMGWLNSYPPIPPAEAEERYHAELQTRAVAA